MKRAIADFHSLLVQNSGVIYFECLIQSFEKSLLQKEQISNIRFFKTLVYISLFRHVPNELAEDNTFYFWPFQFHHCDFIVPVIKELEKSKCKIRVMILRPNLIPYLRDMGVDASSINIGLRLRTPLSWIKRFAAGFRFYKAIKSQIQSTEWKQGAIAAFENISLAEQARSIAEHVSRPKSGQYHMVGHDLTLQGMTIINSVKRLGHTSARIQNGAVNYLLCQYSNIDEIYFWDDLSRRAYLKNSWKGSSHIVGNQKLWDKQQTGISSKWRAWLNANHFFTRNIMVAFSGPGYKTTVQGHLETLKYLHELVKVLPEIGFIIKLHPKDKLNYYHYFETYSNVLITSSLEKELQPDAIDVLMVCDFLITGGSTVALDAMAMKKGVVSIDPRGEMEQFEFLNEPGVTRWTSAEQLDNVVQLVKQQATKEKSVEKLLNNPAICIADIMQNRA